MYAFQVVAYLRIMTLTIRPQSHARTTLMSSSEVNFKIQDEGRLAELGYTQELSREWSLLHNFGASFSIIVRRLVLAWCQRVF